MAASTQVTHLAGESLQHLAFLLIWAVFWPAVRSMTINLPQSYFPTQCLCCPSGRQYPRVKCSERNWPWSFGWRPKSCPVTKEKPSEKGFVTPCVDRAQTSRSMNNHAINLEWGSKRHLYRKKWMKISHKPLTTWYISCRQCEFFFIAVGVLRVFFKLRERVNPSAAERWWQKISLRYGLEYKIQHVNIT